MCRLIQVQASAFFRENIGEISNKGFELLLGGAPVNTPKLQVGYLCEYFQQYQ